VVVTESGHAGDRSVTAISDVGLVSDPPSVLLVDPPDGAGLTRQLERCGFTVTRSATPEAALFEFGQHALDAVVAAVPLPGMGTVALCQQIRMRGDTPTLVVSSGGGHEWLDAIGAGADDHLALPCDERELRARLRALIRRSRGPLSPQRVVKIGKITVVLGRGVVTVEPDLPCTPMQFTLLGYLAGNPGVVVSDPALEEGVRAVHGPPSHEQLEAELLGLRHALAVASGIPGALERVDDLGWRLATESW
jgi:DNA-binding response OmpR family regulator